jgi:hypothetical protein
MMLFEALKWALGSPRYDTKSSKDYVHVTSSDWQPEISHCPSDDPLCSVLNGQ